MFRQFSFYRNLNNQLALIYEIIMGVWRLLLFSLSCLIFAVVCTRLLEGVNVWPIAEQIKNHAPRELARLPILFWVLFVPFQKWQYFRYLFAPLGAFMLIFWSAVFYVRDIYHLPTLGRAFHYVTASLFAILFPVTRIDGGKIDNEDPDDETNLEEKNLLRAIGGPGFAIIQPGNAVAFRDWHETRDIQDSQLYFMRPFEMIARVVNLEDQHGHMEDSSATTSDGIRLHLKNIDYQFSVLHPEPEKKGTPEEKKPKVNPVLQRSQQRPYPFSESAITSIAYSFSVSDKGMDTWHETVKRAVESALGSFVSSHDLDYLTAPRQNGQNPRRELRVELFAPAVSGALKKVGAELHWMDIGQFDIDTLQENKEQDPVDQARTKFWAARWIGDANTIRAYGDATHLAYQELARAEAQAEIIMSITDALRGVSLGQDRAETLRQIFLARTAQILEALRDGNMRRDPPA